MHQESMKLMGMKAWTYWISWYFKYTIFMIITALIMTLIFHVEVLGKPAVYEYGDPSVTFVFLLLYTISVMTFCFAISTFFSTGLTIAA